MPVYNPPSQNRMVSRSNSFIGTIKSILPTKLPWFGSSSDQADTPTKRKQAEEKQDVEEGTRSNKRQRMDEGTVEGRRASGGQSAVPPSASGYLDPPQRVFRETTTVTVPRASPMYTRASSAAAPSRSRSRFSMSPGLGGARGQSMRITRTQSMDPPTRYRSASYKPVLSPMPMTRDVSMEDVSFLDTPTSPSRPFRMRTSLTPQIPDLDLSARRERDMSEPPPLSDLMDKPVFVRAPPEATRQATPMARQASLTLGAVAEAHKQAKPLQRQHSSLMIGSESESMQQVQLTAQRPPAEKALQELDVYKTPLLPTRLRGSNTVPEMFRARRGKAPVLMHDREEKPRLGTAVTTGVEAKLEESPRAKPYAGSGGIRKLLAKRKLEEEEEQERAQASSIHSEVGEETRKTANEFNTKLIAELQPLAPATEAEPVAPVAFIGGREQPSLRVGRARTSRNHDRPLMRRKPGRFSAVDEEEEDEAMNDGTRENVEQANNKAPVVQPPPGFSFAKNTTLPKFDSGDSKEPPIPTLPFSFAKPSATNPSTGSSLTSTASKIDKPHLMSLPTGFSHSTVAPSPPATVAATSSTVSAPAPSTPLLASVPQIALIPASPSPSALGSAFAKATEQSGAGTADKPTSSVPNFFANSSFLSKSSTPVMTPAPTSASAGSNENPSLFGSLGEKKKAVSAEQASVSENKSMSASNMFASSNKENDAGSGASTEPPRLSFTTPASVSAVPTTFATPVLSTAAPEPAKEKSSVIAAPVPATPSMFAFGTPSKAVDKAPTTSTLPFSFGTPSKAPEQAVASPPPSPAPFTFGAPAKSDAPVNTSTAFSFGTPTKVEEAKSDSRSTQTVQAPKPLFGTALATPAVPFTFGTPTKVETAQSDAGSRPQTAEAPQPVTPFVGFAPATSSTPEPAKTVFTFGQPTSPAPASTSTTPVPPEAPKPLFGGSSGFSFGQAASNPPASAPASSAFTFGAASSAPAVENKPFTFGAAAASTSTGFGAPTNGISAPATNKAFAFGGPSAVREVTPPTKEESEVMMDESPVRPPTELSRPELPRLSAGGFSFTLPGSSPPFSQTPQATSAFGFGQPPAASTLFGAGAKPEGKANEPPAEKRPATFGFGQSTTPTTGFAFSQKPVESAPAAPARSFSFASPAATPTGTGGGPFGFGAPQISQSNSFGSATSAPVSPFGPPTANTGFGFGAGTTPTTTAPPFGFSSQPASPAAASAGLPVQNGPAGFAFGAPAAPAPASPFGAPAALPDTGAALFTMGAAPPTGSRQLKALPKRRGGKR